MIMILEDPMGFEEPRKPYAKPSAPPSPPFIEPPPRFAVSEGAGKHVSFWLVIFAIMALLTAIAIVGFGSR